MSFQNNLTVRIYLAMKARDHSRSLKAKIEPANASKKGCKSHIGYFK